MAERDLCVADLRRTYPAWTWEAKRNGFGSYRYVGRKPGSPNVSVYAVGVLCGPAEDDFATQWRVDNGITSKNIVCWNGE